MNAAEIPEQAASDIESVLDDKYGDYQSSLDGETEFAPGSYYEEKDKGDLYWQSQWWQFEHSLKTQSRFFNQSARQHLEALFDGLNTMRTRSGRALIVNAGPGTKIIHFFRARTFQSSKPLATALKFPDKELGPPPASFAQAGRMNAHGISVFLWS